MEASRWSRVLLATAVLLAALAPRSSTWTGTFGRSVVLLEEVDPYYHLRRIELALANDLVPPAFDSYVNHPHGATVDWPPGFDVAMALGWHVYSKIVPEAASPAAFGAVAVAVLGSLAAAAAGLLAARWGLLAGLAGGLALAWSPAAVAYSRVGRLDHHAVEPLCLLLLCGLYAWSRRGASPWRAVALGAALSLTTFFWIAAAFYAAALAFALAFEAWSREADVARHGALAWGVAAAISAALALGSPWGREPAVVYHGLSWFQPLLFGGLATAFGAAALLEGRGVPRGRAWALGGVPPLLAALAVLLVTSGTLGRGLGFLLGEDPVAATLLESRSVVETGPGYALRWLGPLGAALPLLWVVAATLAVRRRRVDPLLAAALAVGLLAAPLAFLQMRFGPHAAVASGLLAAWLLAGATKPKVAGGALAAVAAALAWGVRPATRPDSMVHPYLLGGFDALVWLRQAPPPTSHYRQPFRHPEYGVAAEWVWGHWITQIARKPNIANPLGQTPVNVRGVREVARLFLEESEEEALARIERLGIRYLLLSSIPVTVSDLAVQAGRDPARYVERHPDGSDTFRPPFFDTFHSRLYLGGGAGEGPTDPVSRVRLVFESRVRIEFMGSRPAVRVFEAVPGATLVGRCPAGTVEARAELSGPGLVYTARATPAPGEGFALAMPYATEATPASIPARVTVRCGDRETAVEVPERAVLDGDNVAVGLASARPAP